MMKENLESTDREYLNITKTRIIILACLILGAFLILLFQMLSLQVIRHKHFATLSHENRLKIIPITPLRGEIYSKDHVLLAGNVATYSLIVDPEYVDSMPDFLSRLQEYITLGEEDLEAVDLQLAKGLERVLLKSHVTEREVAIFSANRYLFPGAGVEAASERYYPLSDITAHVIGYVSRVDDKDLSRVENKREYRLLGKIGKLGIEREYENVLKGESGYKQVEINAEGRVIRVLEVVPPRRGNDLFLHIDGTLQIEAYNALAGKKGAIVAIDLLNGGILSLVSSPGYDPNAFVRGIGYRDYQALQNTGDKPLFNRSTSGQYFPGSTIKPFMALAALHYGVRNMDDPTWCPGWFKLPHYSRPYLDWKRGGHGEVNMHIAIAESCNVFFYQLALDLGLSNIREFLQHFGFGTKTGVDLDNESLGLLPSEQWKVENSNDRWYVGDTVIMGIGQGYILATPLQLASAVAALAGNGTWRSPILLEHHKDLHTGRIFPGQKGRESRIPVDGEEAWEYVKGAMLDVVHSERGTARGISHGVQYQIAGKTGTAQVQRLSDSEQDDVTVVSDRLEDHALFIAFAPKENPLIALAIVVENAGSGSSHAAPIARRLLDRYLLERSGI